MSSSLRPHELYSPGNSPGQNTGVASLSLLQEIFPTQGLIPGLLHCKQILYQLSHKGSPEILEWVASPFSRGSSQPRNWTKVSCIAGGFFTNWPIRDQGCTQIGSKCEKSSLMRGPHKQKANTQDNSWWWLGLWLEQTVSHAGENSGACCVLTFKGSHKAPSPDL